MSMRKLPDERKNHPKGLKIKVLRIHTGLGVVTELTDFRNSRQNFKTVITMYTIKKLNGDQEDIRTNQIKLPEKKTKMTKVKNTLN